MGDVALQEFERDRVGFDGQDSGPRVAALEVVGCRADVRPGVDDQRRPSPRLEGVLVVTKHVLADARELVAIAAMKVVITALEPAPLGGVARAAARIRVTAGTIPIHLYELTHGDPFLRRMAPDAEGYQ